MRLVPLRNVRETHELLSVWLLKQDMNKNSTKRHTKMERDLSGALNPRLRTTGDDGMIAWGGLVFPGKMPQMLAIQYHVVSPEVLPALTEDLHATSLSWYM